MHELSIAEAIVAIACDHAAGRKVLKVEVRIGHLRQAVPSALSFAFDLVAEGTAVHGAELVLERVPAVGRCRACETQTELSGFPLECERCGGWELELLQGEELLVDALEIDEEELMTTGGMVHGH
ncbi:MAG: hydrogenase maturation nickel metallochaperone HypA [Solirubrobacteraceae bacterium]